MKSKKVAINPLLLVLVVSVVICAALALSWILAKEVYRDGSKTAKENAENVVINNIGAPSQLVDALLAEKQGCQGSKNVDYIDRVSEDYALVRYGCALDAHSIYRKQNGVWVTLDNTNQFLNGVPICAFVRVNSIPKSISPTCYDGNLVSGVTPPLVSNTIE